MQIQLTKGFAVEVDAEDFARFGHLNWAAAVSKDGRRIYAVRHTSRRVDYRTLLLHREIIGAPEGFDVDHIDHDTLNCRRANLRLATKPQNGANRGPNTNNSSGYKGVTWDRQTGRWRAQIKFNRRHLAIGRFDSVEDAARAYDRRASELFSEFAYVNFP